MSARHILIATGGWPVKPDIPGADLAITSNEAFHLPGLPRRVLVVGGGYIAVEFAGIFNGLGSRVTLSYRGEEILRGFDHDVRTHLRAELENKGITVERGHHVSAIERQGGALVARTDRGDIACDCVMFATGRTPNTAGLGLEAAGVKLAANGAVEVDDYSKSSVPSIFAVGDVTDRIQLTPVAIREGAAVAATLFHHHPTPVNHNNVPSAVFSQPPVGTVGDTEEEALARYGRVEVYRSSFKPLKHTLSGRNEKTLMKLLVEPASQKVVGAHMVGPDAPEIIQGIALGVVAGLTKAQFDATVGIHPTAAEEFVTLKDKVLREA